MSYAVVGAAVGAAGSIASSSISASAAGGGGSRTPRQGPLQSYGSTRTNNILQQYVGRLLAANVNTRAPTFDQWVGSGGTQQFQLSDPGLTADEAMRMGFVDKRGRVPSTFDPTNPQPLTEEQMISVGQMNKQRRSQSERQGRDVNYPMSPAERIADLIDKRDRMQERLASGELPPKRQERVSRKLERIKSRLARAEER